MKTQFLLEKFDELIALKTKVNELEEKIKRSEFAIIWLLFALALVYGLVIGTLAGMIPQPLWP